MAKPKKGLSQIIRPEPVNKKTSSSGNPSQIKMSSMNKQKKANYKAYRGQGR